MAAGHHALRVAKLLIERGAEVDPRESQWDAAPIGVAAYGDDTDMVDVLSRFSTSVWTLSSRGYIDRLRDVLRADPSLAAPPAATA